MPQILPTVVLALSCALAAQAQQAPVYPMGDLLDLCIEGANDSRWGQDEEQKCEQYLRGFTDAWLLLAAEGEVCLPPPGNRADELRMAFMKWGTQNYAQRGMPAGEAVLTLLRERFACP